MKNEYIISLTTIPSKIDNLYLTLDSLFNQTLQPKSIILNIPKRYHFRMGGVSINQQKIDILEQRYPRDKFIINHINNDYGPGTKLIGVLDYDMVDFSNQNSYVIVTDDDLIYKPYMLEHFDNYCKEFGNVSAGSYYAFQLYQGSMNIGQSADGLFLKCSLLEKFSEYYNCIKNSDYVNYQDDIYISFFFHLKNEKLVYINPPENISIYDFHPNSMIDALSELKGKYNRIDLNANVINILESLDKEEIFNFLK